LPRLRLGGVEFVHGDVRESRDLLGVARIDALVECSAEPAVLAGFDNPDYVVSTNLFGAYTCLARRDGALYVFLSTSRVYPVEPLRPLDLASRSATCSSSTISSTWSRGSCCGRKTGPASTGTSAGLQLRCSKRRTSAVS
jgi:NAD dependent epimerase/dehydratase family